MEPFTRLTAHAVPIDRPNVDTDQITPARYLQKPRSAPFADFLFRDLRFNADGSEKPDFVLNRPFARQARIVVAEDNFGCGSSREHAPWALDQFGFRAIIAPSYADIFFNNSFKNGLLPIVLPEVQVDQLFSEALAFPGYQLTIDLERQVVLKPGGEELPFEVQGFRKYCLLNGFDDIGLTLRHADKIKAFEAERLTQKPWLARSMTS